MWSSSFQAPEPCLNSPTHYVALIVLSPQCILGGPDRLLSGGTKLSLKGADKDSV